MYSYPTTDIVNIGVEEYGYVSADLMDYTGRILLTTSAGKMNLNDKPEGIYLVQIRTTNDTSTRKIIKTDKNSDI